MYDLETEPIGFRKGKKTETKNHIKKKKWNC